MILWKDFILDDVIGPTLRPDVCREAIGESPDVMEDARAAIQETGREQRPARMVGHSSSDSARNGMEADRSFAELRSRRRGGG